MRLPGNDSRKSPIQIGRQSMASWCSRPAQVSGEVAPSCRRLASACGSLGQPGASPGRASPGQRCAALRPHKTDPSSGSVGVEWRPQAQPSGNVTGRGVGGAGLLDDCTPSLCLVIGLVAFENTLLVIRMLGMENKER